MSWVDGQWMATSILLQPSTRQMPTKSRRSNVAYEMPLEFVSLIAYLFTEVMDGRNASVSDGIKRALGLEPRDFSDYVRETANTGIWNQPESVNK